MKILLMISLLSVVAFQVMSLALVANDNNTYVAEPEYEEEGIRVEDGIIAGAVLWAMYALFVSLEIDEYLFSDVDTEQFPKNKDRFEFTLINDEEIKLSYQKNF